MPTLDLPVLDASLRHQDPTAFDAELFTILARWGFVAIRGHGVPQHLLTEAYTLAEQLFALPGSLKRTWERPGLGRQRGYTGFGVEHAKDRAVHDLKEFWQIGRTLPAGHAASGEGGIPPNVWPDLPRFRTVVEPLFASLDRFSRVLLHAIASGVGLDAADLDAAVAEGNSVLRVIHYPPIRPTDPPDAVRAAAHEDVNLLTVLPASTHPGLELRDRDGTWHAVSTPPDVVICDTGDIFQRLTSGRLPATTHRVVTPEGLGAQSRYSLPFFVHPRPDWVITSQAGDQPPITAGAFLKQRLEEIGVA